MTKADRIPLAVLNTAIPQAVRDTLHARDRLTPMLAGASCIRNVGTTGQLVVRTVNADIEVAAPGALLEKVFDLCDGTSTFTEILTRVDSGARQEFADFMTFLLKQGALIDANLICAEAVRYGFQFSPFGLAAPAPVTNQISARFLWNNEKARKALPENSVRVSAAPLNAFFESRSTHYTFDDRSISAKTLHQLLWSAAGVVSRRHPRTGHGMPQRTLASAGGMHLLKLYVALRRPVGAYLPGVYRVDYPAARTVALHRVSNDIQNLPLTNSKPWHLTFATGALFVVADPAIAAMRYRSRSTQYLFMEAGAALHNIALSAHALGLGQATIGGFYERAVARLCQLDEKELVLGSAIFGALASDEQLAQMARSPDIDFAWVNGESEQFSMKFHLARAQLKSASEDHPHTWGRGTDPMLAMRKAIAEAIEREGYRQSRRIVEGVMSKIKGAVDPTLYVQYAEKQYASSHFPFQPFDRTRSHAWTDGKNLCTGEKVRVLAELVYSRAGLTARNLASLRPVTQATTSGCAAGADLQDATARAMREVIERDAFMRHWLQQSSGSIVLPGQWPAAITARMRAMEAAGCKVQLQKLDSPWMHVALVAVQHEQLHFTTMGTAASHDFRQATEAALDETEARVYAWLHGHKPSISKQDEVNTAEHHFELYGLKQYFRSADRVLFPVRAESTTRWPRSQATKTLNDMVAQFFSAGLQPLAIDITPDQNFIDQGRTPLSVARVLIPGLLPISFGFQNEPLGMVPKVNAGSKVPHPFP